MAPPKVTYFVPGVTGSIQPRGTASARICSNVMPGSARTTPRSQSAKMIRSSASVCTT
ncbi:hypothetical protein AWB82_07090 [Caballeronia glebae]|uniref:Uncharacterized protein n=1 Tax=Caballeronia glebae TaxID=1777143 RepID=A0A158DS43_9BURK|nr:hypothetical protein AWB82_07090 [Caballeronia glebae]